MTRQKKLEIIKFIQDEYGALKSFSIINNKLAVSGNATTLFIGINSDTILNALGNYIRYNHGLFQVLYADTFGDKLNKVKFSTLTWNMAEMVMNNKELIK